MTRIAAVVIGRNEGARLVACLASLEGLVSLGRKVYVDSGSTDGSVDAARTAGAEVVALDTLQPFTAARARNAGLDQLRKGAEPDLVQFLDGDCALDPSWLTAACSFLDENPKVAVVCGRRRERFPTTSVYNRMCDAEWDTPTGEAHACGGDALIRWQALEDVGGYNPDLIAGEEPEMCLRMRRLGWQIWRLDAEMTLHDAAMSKFSQFWKRMQRGGFAAAEGAAMYGRDPERHGVATLRRALLWGAGLPIVILAGLIFVGPIALWGLLAYPAQILRLALRDGGGRFAWEEALFLTIGKFAETTGIFSYHLRRLRGGNVQLIEYK
ncbi:glycosyltransferase [Roseobacter litoralis]|uniref:glycosyltransferase n=1 Tax=Roseobacter litoralis TaxID=42443 RepID=UPI0024902AAE|nr:glycosyltransferase family 2 protein [Roseobacter litoralis]